MRTSAVSVLMVRGPFPGHLLTSHDEHTHCDPRPFARQFARGSQAGEGQPKHRPGDPRGVEFVVLAEATTIAGRHPGGFDDGQPGTLQPLGPPRSADRSRERHPRRVKRFTSHTPRGR